MVLKILVKPVHSRLTLPVLTIISPTAVDTTAPSKVITLVDTLIPVICLLEAFTVGLGLPRVVPSIISICIPNWAYIASLARKVLVPAVRVPATAIAPEPSP